MAVLDGIAGYGLISGLWEMLALKCFVSSCPLHQFVVYENVEIAGSFNERSQGVLCFVCSPAKKCVGGGYLA